MRAALWLLALFGIAVAIALFAGNNQGTVTLYWPPYRVDLSLNLVLLLLFGAFVFVHAVLGAMSALFDLPKQALRWRTQQKERAMYGSLLDGWS
ncbi:MAG: heme biosynthesis protein HemY, partial [Ramlibacter sp.]|nr:heme biosynthesis protein HemY [Ramlibacter sp.]